MKDKLTRVTGLFNKSIGEFFVEEANNVVSGVSERNLCGRLLAVLERNKVEFGLGAYYVDAEYNRKQGGQVKTMMNDAYEIVNITPDVIVHSRGESVAHDNLIAIEMKKAERPSSEKASDRERLVVITKKNFANVWGFGGCHPEHVCGYTMGVYVEIDARARRYLIEFYQRGAMTEVKNGAF